MRRARPVAGARGAAVRAALALRTCDAPAKAVAASGGDRRPRPEVQVRGEGAAAVVKALSGSLRAGRVGVLGDVFVDLLFASLDAEPEPGKEVYAMRFAIEPGGHAITAVTLARLGRPVSVGAVLGREALADAIVQRLEAEGVDTSCLVRSDAGTPVTAAVSYRGDRSFITYPGGTTPAALALAANRVLARDPTHLHLSAGHPLADRLLGRAHAAGMSVSLSIGWQPDLFGSPALRARMRAATLVAVNDREARALAGEAEVDAAVDRLSTQCDWLLVTLGAEGSLLVQGERRWRAEAEPAQAVDTTGAGDVFLATLLDGAMAGLDEDRALRRASHVAARAVEHLGGATGVPRDAAGRTLTIP